VRLETQRSRLLSASAIVFAASGYAEASAEAIAREAGMSKATFYEHFANKEEAILALFDTSVELVLDRMAEAAQTATGEPVQRVRAGLHAFVLSLAEHPEYALTLLVHIVGAGPRATERRDAAVARFAAVVDAENERTARRHGSPRFHSIQDSYALVGAISELISRQVRLGEPADVRDLEPVIERLILGMLSQSRR